MGCAQASPVRGLLCKPFSDDDFFLTRPIPNEMVKYPLQSLDLIRWWARDSKSEGEKIGEVYFCGKKISAKMCKLQQKKCNKCAEIMKIL